MSEGPSDRRWFRFSLRALFLLVTLVALWFGYYRSWMLQRQDARAWMHAQGIGGSFGGMSPNSSAFPWGLRLLGEERLEFFLIEYEPTSRFLEPPPDEYLKLVERIRRLFPEADVWDVTPDPKGFETQTPQP